MNRITLMNIMFVKYFGILLKAHYIRMLRSHTLLFLRSFSEDIYLLQLSNQM